MLALKVSLALIVFGGTAALVLHLSLASAHNAPPSGAPPSRRGIAPAQVPRRLHHGPACVRLP